MPWVPTRQWVVSVPIPLRYSTASSQDLTATVHTSIRTTIAQYDVNQAVTHGMERQKVQPGSVTFIQRYGSALNLNVYYKLRPLGYLEVGKATTVATGYDPLLDNEPEVCLLSKTTARSRPVSMPHWCGRGWHSGLEKCA